MALFRLITVDITNTMIRVIGSPGKHYAYVAASHGIEVDEEIMTKVFYKCYKEYCSRYPNFGAGCQMSAKKWWSDLVVDCFNAVGMSNDSLLTKIAKELFDYYTTSLAWELLPGTTQALADLQRFDAKLGVISNYDHRLYKVLEAMNLSQYFDFVLPSYDVGAEKPSPLIFQRALENAGVDACEAVHFGDNVEKDFFGAKNAGLHAYLLETKGVSHKFVDNKFVVKSSVDFVTAITPNLRMKDFLTT